MCCVVGCGDSTEAPEDNGLIHFHHPEFTNVERRNLKWEEFNVNLDVPTCFERENYGSYSVFNKMMLVCSNNSLFITLDGFSAESVAEYRYYFQDDLPEGLSDAEFILRYAANLRSKSLDESSISQLSRLKLKNGGEMALQSIYGKERNYSDELFFLYGSVESQGNVILIQGIFEFENLKFLLGDFKVIFSSLKVNR